MPTKSSMIFIVSSMPNQTRKSGTSAEMGRKRSGSRSGLKKCLMAGNVPMTMPSGIETRAASPNPRLTRRKLPQALRTRASSKWSTGNAFRTSVGEGRMIVGTRFP